MVRFSDFDLNFSDGRLGEILVEGVLKDILTGTVEVKKDNRWADTGNIYVETECFYQTSNSWERSGLTTSKATHFAFVLEDIVLILPTDDLREICKIDGHFIEIPNEPNPTRGYLIRIDDIVRRYRYVN